MKYLAALTILILLVMTTGTASISEEVLPTETKRAQPEIFSEKSKPNKCIDKIQVQQRSMVSELKKIRNLLKKKKD
tara:strand:- start:259 stop:486 length:228 start_codon:yes stop_codon:yes gene_type:complete